VGNVRQITRAQRQKLATYTGLGKQVKFKDKNGGPRFVLGRVVDEVAILSGDYKHVIQKIELIPSQSWDGSRFAYRSGYYTWDASMLQVKWGQYHACLSAREFARLAREARRKGWLAF
jgi:hypothetical protein